MGSGLPPPGPITKLTPEQIGIGAALVGGVSASLLLNVGPSWVDKGLAFMAGAVPSAIVADWAASEDSVNVHLAEASLGMLQDWPMGPITFGLVFIGTTMIINLAYLVLIMPEVSVFLDLVPVIRGDKISVAIVVLGFAATLLFSAIAGWTVEVIQFVIDPKAEPFKGRPPGKPGGRHVWGLSKLPKDIVYLLLAEPIALIQTAEYAIRKRSIFPLFFAPVKMAVDQWSRVGDVILDLYVPEEMILHSVSKAARWFEHIVGWLGKHVDSASDSLAADVAHYGKPETSNLRGATTTDPTWQKWEQWYAEDTTGQAQILYPFLYAEGDNDISPST